MNSHPVDLIVPVYNGLEALKRCLQGLLRHAQQTPHHIVIIDDASPDPAVRPFLHAFKARHPQVELLENPHNLGFVGTVNRGMRLHPERDLVLVNSDVETTNDWLDRLRACAYRGGRVGTVTPFSNNATICSYPRFPEGGPLPAGSDPTALDAAFARANPEAAVEIPTGVGFCLYIRRACIDDTGYFDAAAFGRGYGEENDFCLRAAQHGWRHLLCCDTFIYHAGGVSFEAEKDARVKNALRVLDQRYPDYHQAVYAHIQADPAAVYRFKARIEALRNGPRPRVLFLTHHLGGGTAKHIRELAGHIQDQAEALLIKPLREGAVILDLDAGRGEMTLAFALPAQLDELLHLLRYIGISRVHFHHTLGLETSLWGLPQLLGAPYDVTLHDYYFINANPTQTDPSGRFTRDFSRQGGNYPLPVSVEQWQANQRPLLEKAERVIAPSRFVMELYRAHFPEARYRVAFHPDWEQQAPFPAVQARALGAAEPLRILVFGAISIEKGADLLEAVANRALEQGSALEFHLLGYAYRPLSGAVHEHGAYDESSVVEQIKALKPHLAWFPALWPESYSYTLSEALQAGAPVAAPDIGAFPERLRGRPLTWVRPWDDAPEAWAGFFHELRQEFPVQGATQPWPEQPAADSQPGFYRTGYLKGARLPEPDRQIVVDHAWLENALSLSAGLGGEPKTLSRRERLLVVLIRLRQGRIGRWLTRLVPVALQRRFKRRLSRRPLHEIV